MTSTNLMFAGARWIFKLKNEEDRRWILHKIGDETKDHGRIRLKAKTVDKGDKDLTNSKDHWRDRG